MNAFDAGILTALNGHVGDWPALDHVVVWLAVQSLFKGALVAAVVWGLWFVRRTPEALLALRERLIAAMLASLAAEALARVLTKLLPFRPRPLHGGEIPIRRAADVSPDLLGTWSSFPSDHATLFFAVAVGVYCASRRVGAALLLYVTLVICLPRIYLGLHHPTDILAGAVLGGATALLFQTQVLRTRLARPLLAWEQRSPGSFYALVGFFLLEFAVLFDGLRSLHALLRDHFGTP